jgi:hypothetical protein
MLLELRLSRCYRSVGLDTVWSGTSFRYFGRKLTVAVYRIKELGKGVRFILQMVAEYSSETSPIVHQSTGL